LNIKHFDTDATFCECFINCLEDYVFAHLTVDFLAICTDEKQRMPVNLLKVSPGDNASFDPFGLCGHAERGRPKLAGFADASRTSSRA
jgi:hypothetical protein